MLLKRTAIIALAAVCLLPLAYTAYSYAKPKKDPAMTADKRTAYDFTLTAIDGDPMPLAQFKGKVVMLVNTASFCGHTPQYAGLQALVDTYGAKGFTVVGVPSGDFMGQEYKTNKEIKDFCTTKFNIKFPLGEKSVVKGDKAIPVFKWAADVTGESPEWNFHKYLIGRDGKLVQSFGAGLNPDKPEVKSAIEKALASS